MNISEITREFSKLKVLEKRAEEETYSEVVFSSKDVKKWENLFNGLLGPALKPAGVSPTEEHQQITKEFGGIYKGQTLFKKDFDNTMVLAMFWPWQEESYITLKVVELPL